MPGSSTHSGSSHSTPIGMNPQKKCRAAFGDSTASSSQHSTMTTTLLFADVAAVDSELQDHLVESARISQTEDLMSEVDEVLKEFKPDIYVSPTLIKTKGIHWRLATESWRLDSQKYIPLQNVNESLHTAYEGCLSTLRRFTPSDTVNVLKVFLVRLPKCKNTSTKYCLQGRNRAAVAKTIFNLLAKEEAPFLVLGNLGFTLASFLYFLEQFQDETHISLKDHIQMIQSEDCELTGIFKATKGECIQRQTFPSIQECLGIHIFWNCDDRSGEVTQLTQSHKRDVVTLLSRRQHYLELLVAAENHADLRGRLATILLRPVVSSTTGVIDVNKTLEKMDSNFELLKQARAWAGVETNNTPLCKEEFDTALAWLKDTFEKLYMENVDLKDRITLRRESNSAAFTRTEKKKLRSHTRNAFKSWTHSLFGNHSFFMAVLRRGFFDASSQMELLIAVLQEEEFEASADRDSTEHDKKKLREQALEARSKLRAARRLKNLEPSQLLHADIQLLEELDSGLLVENVSAANQAYGHGEGIKHITKEEYAISRMQLL